MKRSDAIKSVKKPIASVRRAASRKYLPRQCAWEPCGEWFVPRTKVQVFHSSACNLKARQERYWERLRKAARRVKAMDRAKGKKK